MKFVVIVTGLHATSMSRPTMISHSGLGRDVQLQSAGLNRELSSGLLMSWRELMREYEVSGRVLDV